MCQNRLVPDGLHPRVLRELALMQSFELALKLCFYAQLPLAVTHQAMLTVTDHLLFNIYVSCNIVYFHYVSILLYTEEK